MKYDLINVSALVKVPDNRTVWMTYDLITGSIKQVEKIYTGPSFLMWTRKLSKRSKPEETYFPPQKIFVVITRLERLKNEKKQKHICDKTCQTWRIIVKKPHLLELVIFKGCTNLTLYVLTAWIKSLHILFFFFQCHTHPHPTMSVTVPGLSQCQWMSVVGV